MKTTIVSSFFWTLDIAPYFVERRWNATTLLSGVAPWRELFKLQATWRRWRSILSGKHLTRLMLAFAMEWPIRWSLLSLPICARLFEMREDLWSMLTSCYLSRRWKRRCLKSMSLGRKINCATVILAERAMKTWLDSPEDRLALDFPIPVSEK